MASNRSNVWNALIGLSVTGLVISIYQTIHFHMVRSGAVGFDTFCNINEKVSCTAVESSSFAELFWGIPLSAAAGGWYMAFLMILFLGRDEKWRDDARRAALLFTGWATLMSAVYLGIMATVLETYCILCLVIDGINVLSLLLVLSLKPKLGGWGPGKLKTLGTIIVACVVGGLIFGKVTGLRSASNLSSKEVTQVVNRILTSKVEFVQVHEDSPSIGPASAPITIVKFSDLQCPACQRGAFALHPVLSQFKGQIRFVFKHFPLDPTCNRGIKNPLHPYACAASRHLQCATEQGKFSAAYEHIFQNQEKLSNEMLASLVTDIDLDAGQFDACLKSGRAEASISRDVEEGIGMEIQSTPTFFMNGHRITGGLPTSIWREVLNAALKK